MSYIEQFQKSLQDNGKSPLTIKAYLSDLKQFELWLEETYGEVDFSPFSITKLDVAQYKTHMMNLQRKPAGINRVLKSISAFCEWARKQGLLQGNPTEEVSKAKEVKAPPKALEERDCNRLMRTVYKIGNKRDIAIVELMVGAGLRIGEVEGLILPDIELGERKGMVVIRQGKGSKYREVPLNKDVRKALAEYLEERPDYSIDALFISQEKNQLSATAIWRAIKKYGEAAGLKDLTPHSLRHTFGTRLVRKHGVDLVTTAQLMGHSNIATTALYTKASRQDLISAVEKLAKW